MVRTDEFVSPHDLYESSRAELEEFVRPKVFRILLLTFLFYPISFLFFGKWAQWKRWSFLGSLYLFPLATFFAMAILSAIARPQGSDPFKSIAVDIGLLIPVLWPIALVHTYKIRFKYTILSASQRQLNQWIEQLAERKAEEQRWEHQYHSEKAELEKEQAERKEKARLESERQKMIWEEIQRERQAHQTQKDKGRPNNNHHFGTHKSEESRWASSDPYLVLGVSRASSDLEVRRAWLQLMRQWHPDRAPQGSTELYTTRSQKINWARNQCQASTSCRRAA